jgi:hypothetical protein
MKRSSLHRLIAVPAPLFVVGGVVMRQAHVFGSGAFADALFGVFIGLGIGLSVCAPVLRKRCA